MAKREFINSMIAKALRGNWLKTGYTGVPGEAQIPHGLGNGDLQNWLKIADANQAELVKM